MRWPLERRDRGEIDTYDPLLQTLYTFRNARQRDLDIAHAQDTGRMGFLQGFFHHKNDDVDREQQFAEDQLRLLNAAIWYVERGKAERVFDLIWKMSSHTIQREKHMMLDDWEWKVLSDEDREKVGKTFIDTLVLANSLDSVDTKIAFAIRDALRVQWRAPYYHDQQWPHDAVEFDSLVDALADMTMDDQIALIGMLYPEQLVHINQTTTAGGTL